jgi:hypothetical protein
MLIISRQNRSSLLSLDAALMVKELTQNHIKRVVQ